jgi:DNA-binding transcriptional regulator YiaG
MLTNLDVKAIRKARKETQAEFATYLGVTALTVSLWERKGPPSNGAALKLLEMLRDQSEAA